MAGYNHFSTSEDVITFCTTHFESFFSDTRITSSEYLSGGVANKVLRLHLQTNTNETSNQTKSQPKSVIFKYYPPFLAFNSAIPFSQDRYNVEKEALQLAKQFQITSVESNVEVTIKSPTILTFSDTFKVIIMEDAGSDIVSLMSYFSTSPVQHHDMYKKLTPTRLVSYLTKLLLSVYKVPVSSLSSVFENKAAWNVLNAHVVNNFESNLKRFGCEKELAGWIGKVEPWGPPKEGAKERVFIMGDFWPNSVYLSYRDEKKRSDGVEGTVTIWILDWEIARIGDVFSDTRQMCVNLFLMEQKPEQFRVEEVAQFRQLLVKSVQEGMRQYGKKVGEKECLEFLELLCSIIGNEFWQFPEPGRIVAEAARIVKSYLQCDE
ncbi:kinase-like domain-containing protein [Paraphysoderma sedebokerense]|nr:kinase-like domain-containing protein [Paraphysoderma sedebokerense]